MTYGQLKKEIEKMGFKNVNYSCTGLTFSSDTLDMYLYYEGDPYGLTLGSKGSSSTISFGFDVKGCLDHLGRILENEKRGK